jgi:hypothetical protein
LLWWPARVLLDQQEHQVFQVIQGNLVFPERQEHQVRKEKLDYQDYQVIRAIRARQVHRDQKYHREKLLCQCQLM